MPDPLDIEQPDELLAYLRDSGRIARDETPEFRVLAGGVSNRTVLVKRASGESWVIKQALAKLRVKVDWFSDVSRIHREALALKYLPELAPPGTITPLIFEDHEHHLLAMAAVPEPHENWKTMLMAGRIEQNHVEQFARLLRAIHVKGRTNQLAKVFDDRSFFESLRLEPYYLYAARQVPEAMGFLEKLVASTRARRVTVVHGDYSPKNVLVHQNRLVLLDHEVIHYGEPAFDVGFALTHLLSKAHHFTARRAQFEAMSRVFWQTYREGQVSDSGLEIQAVRQLEMKAVRHTLGCLLARVAGRSTLEYLNDSERVAQSRVVVRLMNDPPRTVPELISAFVSRL